MINAPFGNRRLIRFDISVRIRLNPTRTWVAFNPLDPFMINPLIRVGAPAATSLRPVAPPAQTPAIDRGAAPSAQESISLEPGKPVERELSGDQSHFYKVTTTSGQYLRITVSQQGIDTLVALFTPDGKKISEVKSDSLIEGSETVSVIAEEPGAYLIKVSPPEKTAKTGRYEIKVEELRAATAEDKYRVAGEAVFREAEQLRNGTLEAKRKSIEKYHEALELCRSARDRSGEAATFNNIGDIYESLGEMQKALEKYNESLPLRRAVDDRATSELMKRFYQGMLGPEALRPAGALRQAQLSILKEKHWREPYYWATFVLQGEWK
jgi:CHAT domain-containing protein/tetratricopeptide repeat protein/pre-peptidase